MDSGLWLTIVLILLGLAAAFVAFSNSETAVKIRTALRGADSRTARRIESVEDETAAAQQIQKQNVALGNMSLYQVKIKMNQTKGELQRNMREVKEVEEALLLARQNNDREGFDALVVRLDVEKAELKLYTDTYEQLDAQFKKLGGVVDQETYELRQIAAEALVLQTADQVAGVVIQVNEAAAGLSGENASDTHMAEARRIAAEKTARASAAEEAATIGLTPGQKAEKLADAYLKKAQKGQTTNADALWNAMGPTEEAKS